MPLKLTLNGLSRFGRRERPFLLDPHGNLEVQQHLQTTHPVAAAGQYFVATNPTVSTAVAYAVQASFSETVPYIILRTKAGYPQRKLIYLEYIKLITAVTPASSTSAQFAITIDNIDRLSTGGTDITPQNPNMSAPRESACTLTVGTPTATANSGARRLIARGLLRSAIPVTGDTYMLNFGNMEKSTGQVISGTSAIGAMYHCPPVVLEAGNQVQSCLLHLWFPSNVTTAATFEFEMGWWEVPLEG